MKVQLGTRPFLPWFVFLVLFTGQFAVAAIMYVNTAVRLQPDLKQAAIRVNAPDAIPLEEQEFELEMTAATALPKQGVPVSVEIINGSEWLAVPEPRLTLRQDSLRQVLPVRIKDRPLGEAAEVALKITAAEEHTHITPGERITLRIAPKPLPPPPPPVISVTAPREIPTSQHRFSLEVRIANLTGSDSREVEITHSDSSHLNQPRMRFTLTASQPAKTLEYRVLGRPLKPQDILFQVAAADAKLPSIPPIRLHPAEPPPPVPVAKFTIVQPEVVKRNERHLRQDFVLANADGNAPYRIRVMHDGGSAITPAEQELVLSRAKSLGRLDWQVHAPPATATRSVTFRIVSDPSQRGKPLTLEGQWTVALEPLIPPPPADESRVLLVLLETFLNGEEEAGPWFAQLLRETVRPLQDRLRGEGLVVLRKDNPLGIWDYREPFGGDQSYDALSVDAAWTELTNLLKNDTDDGPVVVLWANGSPPPKELNLKYPLKAGRPFTLIWLDGLETRGESLLDEWRNDPSAEKFIIRQLTAPENVLKPTLETALKPNLK